MAKTQQSAQFVVTNPELLIPEGPQKNHNLRVFTGTVNIEGKPIECLITCTRLDAKPSEAAEMGQPWEETAELWSWQRTKKGSRPGKASLNTADGERSGFRLIYQLGRYLKQYDNRQAKAAAAVVADNFGDLF